MAKGKSKSGKHVDITGSLDYGPVRLIRVMGPSQAEEVMNHECYSIAA